MKIIIAVHLEKEEQGMILEKMEKETSTVFLI